MLNQENYKIQQFLVHLFNVDTSYSTCFHLTEPILYQLTIDKNYEENNKQDFTSFVEQYQMIYRKEFKPLNRKANLPNQGLYKNPYAPTYPTNSYEWIKGKQKKLKQQTIIISTPSQKKQQKLHQQIVYESLQLNTGQQVRNISSPRIKQKSTNSINNFELNSTNRTKKLEQKQSLKTPQFKQRQFSILENSNISEKGNSPQKVVEINKIENNQIQQSKVERIRSFSGSEKLAAHQLIIGTINGINQLVHKMEDPKLVRNQSEESPPLKVPSRLGIVPAKLISIDVKKYKQQ